MSILQIQSLSYCYPGADEAALTDVSVTIRPGDFLAVTGANNSGKSTLCYALAGVVPHLFHGEMKGRVQVNGRDSREMQVSDIAVQVGLVLQNPFSQMSGVCHTVEDEVAFGLENQGICRDEMGRRIEDALSVVGLAGYGDRSPQHLSGGQQQRLALATILAVDPAVVVLDEPTTFLDPRGANLVFQVLSRLQRQGKAIVIAEQRLDLVGQYADRVVCLDKGVVVLNGPPAEVLASPVMKQIGLEWVRYTQVADLASREGLWPAERPLPVTCPDTVNGLLHDKASG